MARHQQRNAEAPVTEETVAETVNPAPDAPAAAEAKSESEDVNAEEFKAEKKPEEQKHDGPMASLEKMKAAGQSEAEAAAEIVEHMAKECGAHKDQAKAFAKLIQEALTAKAITGVQGKPCEPYFRCQAVTPHGIFHAIGRKFTSDPKAPGNRVLIKELTPAQIKDLEGVNPKFLSVVKIAFE